MLDATAPESYLGKLFSNTLTKSPKEIADYLENDNEVRDRIAEIYHRGGQEPDS